ncbi:MAG: glycosyltransferase family 2 protein [Bacteroidales bacterium]|jgi:glycosyltransferase involved in cell wall biosynthesis
MDISIVVPVYNEAESLGELREWIESILSVHSFNYEVIFVDDGSNDDSWKVIGELSGKHAEVKGIRFRRNYGKAAALHTGFQSSSGEIVITLDADLQDSPEEVPELVRMIREEGYDLVSGWKKKRYDPLTKRIPSRFYNWFARQVSGIKLHDFNCGLKAYRNQVVKSIEVYGDMHRYIPFLAKRAGFTKIGEKVVQHQKRKYGVTKYGMKRFIVGYLDLISIGFIGRFGRRPMHLFGTFGTLMFLVGLFAAAWLGGQKIYFTIHSTPMPRVTQSPYFYLALTAMIIGTQLFLAGFLGELITRNSTERNAYLIDETINL